MSASARSSGRLSWFFASLLLVLLAGAAAAEAVEEKVVLRIEPGPTTMSARELSITQDISQARQHGVILVDETVRDESSVLSRTISHHFRAKILSNEARSLADLVIPYETAQWYLKRWWGKTILPDGTQVELGKEDLKEQILMVGPGWSVTVRKAALPGVVPGCVIDYGYELRGGGLDEWVSVPLQRHWPIQEFRYQWFPAEWLPSQYFVRRIKGPEIEVIRQKTGVFIEGTDLPPAIDESYTPPDDLVRAGANLFYSIKRPNPDPNSYWNFVAEAEEKKVVEFLGAPRAVKKAVARIGIRDDAPLTERLAAAYVWLDRNIVNEAMRTAEDRAAAGEKLQKSDPEYRGGRVNSDVATAESVLAMGRGGPQELRYLYVGLARALGAKAHIVMAADRTERLWQRSMMSKGQLDHRVIAVRDPNAPIQSSTLVDPGSGLPFGSIPWRLTPARALVATETSAGEIELVPSEAGANVMESKASITFEEQEGSAPRVEWSASGAGQSGYEERLKLRALAPEKRQERIDQLCGAGGDFEVSRAMAPDLNDFAAGYHIDCVGLLTTILVDETQDRFALSIAGAWLPAAPWFPSATRTLQVVFSYRRVDRTTLDVAAPPGFVHAQAPEAVVLDSPYGTYSLRVTEKERGYRVDRAFTLKGLTVELSEYDRLRAFLDKVRLADRTRLEFVRSRGSP
ncbi:MAG TPA: DUF3857 domain-containing protein [Candidatus Polarisedimenticolia bacterium]|nr:DUF3857 domain-containing protein [Candidatus Polarisedimenticolia bacterium]